MDHFLGHPINYWIELNSRAKELKAEELIQEIAELKGKLSFVESRLDQIQTVIKK